VGKRTNIKWLSEPQKRDYAAGKSYLSLTFEHQAAKNVAEELERAETSAFARRIFSELPGCPCLGSAIAMWKNIEQESS
jgi:Fe-S cluster assembly iron-binding protein IscA